MTGEKTPNVNGKNEEHTGKTAMKTMEEEGEVSGTDHMQLVHKLLTRFFPPELGKADQEG